MKSDSKLTKTSWTIALCSCAINFLLDGLTRISGILFVSVQQIFCVSRQQAAFPFALCVAIRNISGPCIGVLAEKYGPGSITLVGGLVSAIGVGLCYFAKTVTHLILSWGVLFGVGYGMGSILLTVIITKSYRGKMATANGLAYSGSCIGSIALPPLMQLLLSIYGLQGTLLVFSGIILHCIPLSLLILYHQSSHIKELFCKKRNKKSVPKLVGVHVGQSEQKQNDFLHTKASKLTNNPAPSSIETDSGKGSNSWQNALEDKVSFLSAVSSGNSLYTLSTISTINKKNTTISNHQNDSNTKSMELALNLILETQNLPSEMPPDKNNIVSAKFFIPSDDSNEDDDVSSVRNDIVIGPDELIRSTRTEINAEPMNEKVSTDAYEKPSEENQSSDSNCSSGGVHNNMLKTPLKCGERQNICEMSLDNDSGANPTNESQNTETQESSNETQVKQNITSKKSNEIQTKHNLSSEESDEVRIQQSISLEESYETPTKQNLSSEGSSEALIQESIPSGESNQTQTKQNLPSEKSSEVRIQQNVSSEESDETPTKQNLSSEESSEMQIQQYIPSEESNQTQTKQNLLSQKSSELQIQQNISSEESKETQTKQNSSSGESNKVQEKQDTTSKEQQALVMKTEVLPPKDKAFKRRTYPEIKVSVIEYVLTAPDYYSEDHINSRLNHRNNYRRHANSISYSLESPNFILEPAEKSKIKRSFTSKSLMNFNFSQTNAKPITDQQSTPSNGEQSHSSFRSILRSFAVFKNPVFLCIAVIMTIYEFIFVTISTIVIDYSRNVGCDATADKWILITFSVGNVFSRFVLGRVTDSGAMASNTFAAVCFSGISVAMIGMIFANGFGGVLAAICAFGIAESGVITMFPVLTKEFIEDEQLTMALSSGYFGPGLIVLFIPVAIGAFHAWTGSYVGLLSVITGLALFGAFMCLTLPWLKQRRTRSFR